MKAYKCDRCGKFFVHLSRGADKIFITDSYKGDAHVRIKDLCADCQIRLDAWWMNEQDDEKEVANGDSN